MNWKQAVALGLCSVGCHQSAQPEYGLWVTLFEGEVTPTQSEEPLSQSNGPHSSLTMSNMCNHISLFGAHDVRLTIDGVCYDLELFYDNDYMRSFGNRWLGLYDTDTTEGIEDTGEDYYGKVLNYDVYFYFRDFGPYNVKLEYRAAEMYDYNGVILPRLPFHSHKDFLGHFIYRSGGSIEMQMSSEIYSYSEDGMVKHPGGSTRKVYTYSEVTKEWVFVKEEHYYEKDICPLSQLIWTNGSVYDVDTDELLLPETDPIPVYS